GECLLGGELFAAMDSAQNHSFQFGEAISLYVNCKDQAEIDFLWDRLTRDGAESACGWLKDPYGVSWQIVPQFLQDILVDGTEGNEQAMMQAMSQMRKLDESVLRAAYF